MNVNKPEPVPHGTGRRIVDLVVEDFRARAEQGKAKYGEYLHAHNGRNPLVDLQQELMDAVMYLRQEMEQQASVTAVPSAETILEEANRLVNGDRGEAYGHPLDDFTRTGEIVTPLLSDVLKPGAKLRAEHVAKVMIAVKLSRETNHPKRDNRVDGAGYWECLDKVVEERKRRVASGEVEWQTR